MLDRDVACKLIAPEAISSLPRLYHGGEVVNGNLSYKWPKTLAVNGQRQV